MTVDEFFANLDKYFSQGKFEKVQAYLDECEASSREKGDISLLLAVLNEQVGMLRSTGRFSEAVSKGREALKLLESAGVVQTVHNATTMLNTATALRGMGDYQESLLMYQEALRIFEKNLSPYDYRIASLYNNMSIVYEKLLDYSKARECIIKGIDIIKENENAFIELATGYVNLAQINFLMEDNEEGIENMHTAQKIFEKHKAFDDIHYNALLAIIAQNYYRQKEYRLAKEYYKKAMDNVEKTLGKNDQYEILKNNYEMVCMEDERY